MLFTDYSPEREQPLKTELRVASCVQNLEAFADDWPTANIKRGWAAASSFQAFAGQTPDEMSFGTGTKVPEELALAKFNARAARLAANRTMSCERCLEQQATLPQRQVPS